MFSYLIYKMQKYRRVEITIDGKAFSALLSDSLPKQIVGLMYRDSLGDGECMLFVFGHEGSHPIWMHNMRFPIDVAWLDSAGKIVHIEEGLRPCKSLFRCKQYGGEAASKFVIEFRKGTIAKEKISRKSRVNLDSKKKEGR